MTHEIAHPIANAPLHVFERADAARGETRFLAKFAPYGAWPIFISGKTRDEAVDAAEAFRAQTLAKFEAAFKSRAALAARKKAIAAAKE